MREASAGAALAAVLLFAFTMFPQVEADPVSLTPAWSASSGGAHASSLEVVVPAGAICEVTLLARGRDAEAGPFMGLVVEGNRQVAIGQASVALLDDYEVRAHAGLWELSVADDRDVEDWARNLTLEGVSDGRVHVAFAVRDADLHAPLIGVRDSDRALLSGLSARLDIRCDSAVERIEERVVAGFIVFTERGFTEGVGVDVRTAWGHVGLRDGFSFDAAGEVLSAGDIGGDPERVTRVTLDRPGGTDTWLGLPTAYVGGPGDLGWRLHDGPGRYALAIDGASALVQVRGAFFILG